MRIAGHILIWTAFLAASLVSVMSRTEIRWRYYVPLLAAGFVGVVLVRLGLRQYHTATHRITENIQSLTDSMEAVDR